MIEDPVLSYDATYNLWKSTPQTPLYENAITSENVGEDMDGQDRPTISNPGADHLSMDSLRYAPMTPATVGPNASDGLGTSVNSVEDLSNFLVYPVPSSDQLFIKNIESSITRVSIVNLEGKTLYTKSLKRNEEELMIDLSSYLNGLYVVQFTGPNNTNSYKKIIVQR